MPGYNVQSENLLPYVRGTEDINAFVNNLVKKTNIKRPDAQRLVRQSQNDRMLFDDVQKLIKNK